MLKYINEINCNKSLSGVIPAKIIKIVKGEVIVPLTKCINKWVKVFKNVPSKICGRQPLKNLK